MLSRNDVNEGLSHAVRAYWATRDKQFAAQGSDGKKDAGLRSSITGGKHLDAFLSLVRDILVSSGLDDAEVFTGRGQGIVPGYYRPTKDWDIVAVAHDRHERRCLIATVEVKSQAGPSFGNNFNNRVEEALGNSTDFWKAYEHKLLPSNPRPFLGYIFFLEEAPGSTSPVKVDEPHFPVDPVHRNASYLVRYKSLCDRLMRERLYDATSFLVATREGALRGEYSEPLDTATFWTFASALSAKAMAFVNERKD